MIRRNAQQLFQKKNAGYHRRSIEKARKREEFLDHYCVYREYSTREFTMLVVELREII